MHLHTGTKLNIMVKYIRVMCNVVHACMYEARLTQVYANAIPRGIVFVTVRSSRVYKSVFLGKVCEPLLFQTRHTCRAHYHDDDHGVAMFPCMYAVARGSCRFFARF